MCEMCECDSKVYGEPFHGWHLSQAQKDGDVLKKGEWCLVMTNYPSFWWSETPVPDVDTVEWDKAYHRFSNQLQISSIDKAYELVESAKQVGYDPETHGRFQMWLFDYLGKFLNHVIENPPYGPGY